MEINKKTLKTAGAVFSAVSAAVGVISLALAKYEEKQGNYSREFSDCENEITAAVEAIRAENMEDADE
ncbi:MAG: hypothetical protein ACI4N4_04820 [Candidatus Fimenecus sp.]